jgi:hypothetical protein
MKRSPQSIVTLPAHAALGQVGAAHRLLPTAPAELIGHEAVIHPEDRGGSDTWTFRKDGLETTVSISGRLLAENALKQAIIPARNNAYEIGAAAGTRGCRLACAQGYCRSMTNAAPTPSSKPQENSDASKIPWP